MRTPKPEPITDMMCDEPFRLHLSVNGWKQESSLFDFSLGFLRLFGLVPVNAKVKNTDTIRTRSHNNSNSFT